jgi:hypothetical protein
MSYLQNEPLVWTAKKARGRVLNTNEHVEGNKQNRSMCNTKAIPISYHHEMLSIYEANHKSKTYERLDLHKGAKG